MCFVIVVGDVPNMGVTKGCRRVLIFENIAKPPKKANIKKNIYLNC